MSVMTILRAQEVRSDGPLLVLLTLDLLLLLFVRGADVHTPWVLWCLLLAFGPALAEVLRRWRAGTLLGVMPQLLLLIWLGLADQLAVFPTDSLAQTGLVSHALLLAVAVARPWSPTGLKLLLLLVSVPALGYAAWAGWVEQYASSALHGTRDPNNVAISAALGALTLLAWLRSRAAGAAGAEKPLEFLGRAVGSSLWLGVALCVSAAFVIGGLLESRAVSLILLLVLGLRLCTERDGTGMAWLVAAMLGLALASVLLPLPAHTTAAGASDSGGGLSVVQVLLVQRIPLLTSAVDLLRSAPFHGYGLLSFPHLFEAQRSPYFIGPSMAHNDYLQLGVELGWPALLVLFALCALLLRDWVRASRMTLSGERGGVPARTGWLALALLGVFGHGLVNFPFYDGFVLAQVVVLTLVVRTAPMVAAERTEEKKEVSKVAGGVGAVSAVVALLVTGLLTLHLALLSLAAVLFLNHPVLPGLVRAEWQPAQIIAVATRLQKFDFLGGLPAFALGQQFLASWEAGGRERRAMAVAARDSFASAASAAPWIGEYSVQHARLLRETEAPLAIRLAVIERALLWRPNDARLYLALAAHRLQAGDIHGAVSVASQRWLPWCMHGKFRHRERADLLGLAQLALPAAERAAAQTCMRRHASRGLNASAPEEVLARFLRPIE